MPGLNFIKVGPSGGTGGSPFSVIGEVYLPFGSPHRISLINIWAGVYIDAIQLEFTDSGGLTALTPRYGGAGGTLTSVALPPGEFITQVVGTYGDYVNSIEIKTNLRLLPHVGGRGSRKYEYWTTNGQKPMQIQGIWGASGKYLDAIGFFIADD